MLGLVTPRIPLSEGGSDALTESAFAFLPRAVWRSYRERLSALTEGASAFLPRAFLGWLCACSSPLGKGGLHGERSESRRPGVYQLVVSRME